MTEEIKRSNNKRKLNIFLIFLLCSFLAWLVSKLSETYTTSVRFNLVFINAPDSLVYSGASFDAIDARLEANGFQLLRNNFYENKLKINLSKLRKEKGDYFLTRADYQNQVEKQVSGKMNLLELNGDTLFIELYKLSQKEVPIIPGIQLVLAQNHLVNGGLRVDPPMVLLKGPEEELNNISSVYTSEALLEQVSEDFTVSAELIKPPELRNTVFSQNTVKISGKVFRFSEKIIEIPVSVVNIPEGTQISTYPNTVGVLCKAEVDTLKKIEAKDIEIFADFNKKNSGEAILQLELGEFPEGVYDLQLLQDEVEFILKRP